MQSDDESKQKDSAPATVQFQSLEIGDIFHRSYGGRFLTYRKNTKHHATVTHDPKGQCVGVCEPIGWVMEVFPGPSPAIKPGSDEEKAAAKAIHEERKARLESDYEFWSEQRTKKPDAIANVMFDAVQNALYATKRILEILYKPESRVAAKPSA